VFEPLYAASLTDAESKASSTVAAVDPGILFRPSFPLMRLTIVSRSSAGSGKTYTAKGFVEHLLKSGALGRLRRVKR
jgi:hypothetical protein